MIEVTNPTSNKSGDIVVLVVLALGALYVANQAQTPGTFVQRALFPKGAPGGSAVPSTAAASTTTPGSNPTQNTGGGANPWDSCVGFNRNLTSDETAATGGFSGTVAQLFMSTNNTDKATAYKIWRSQGGSC